MIKLYFFLGQGCYACMRGNFFLYIPIVYTFADTFKAQRWEHSKQTSTNESYLTAEHVKASSTQFRKTQQEALVDVDVHPPKPPVQLIQIYVVLKL